MHKEGTPEIAGSKSSLRLAIILLSFLFITGTFGYMYLEKYSFLNAVYMTVITIPTVGFREVFPLTSSGKIFTVLLIVISFGIFVFAISNLTRYMLEGIVKKTFLIRRIKKKINKLENHIILCGHGRNGKQSAQELAGHGKDFVIIENNPIKLADNGWQSLS